MDQECGTPPPGTSATDLTLQTADRVRLQAAVLGSGQRGVVLLHQTNDGLCGWLGYASLLASEGFQVVLFDRRCTFGSDCPAEPAAYDLVGDVKAALTELDRRGATTTAVVGASFGGAVAVGACAVLDVTACAALSPAMFGNYLDGTTDPEKALTAENAVGRVSTPLLVAVAPDDPDSPAADVDALCDGARPGVVTEVRLPAGGAHGWDTLTDPDDPSRPSRFSDQLIAFLDRHLRP